MAEKVVNTDFTQIDRSADAGHFVRHLDRIRTGAQVQAYKRRTVDLLDVREGSHALDVGCGTGDDARAIAERVGATGWVVGLDSSETMVNEARGRVEGSGLPVEYRVGDAYSLDFPDASFDACRVDRLLHHLDDPRAAVNELVRVVRSGARAVMCEPDFETILVDHRDRLLTRRLMNYFCDRHASAWIGRHLLALARHAGLADVAVEPVTLVWTDYEEALSVLWLGRTAEMAAEHGVAPRREDEEWVADLPGAGAAGTFFAARVCFIVYGRKGRLEWVT